MKRFIADESKCTGCRMCELVCAFRRVKRISPDAAAIRIVHKWDEGSFEIIYCRHCDEPSCMEVCPTGAISRCAPKALSDSASGRQASIGVVTLNEDECALCGACVEACSFNAISIPDETKPPIKCDLCEGKPLCVEFCAPGALVIEPL